MAGGLDITEEVSASTLAYPAGAINGTTPTELGSPALNGTNGEEVQLGNGTATSSGGNPRNGEALALGGQGDVNGDPVAKKRGFLFRTASGKSNGHLESSPNGTPTCDAAVLEETSPKSRYAWFGGVLGRRSRPSSADGDASSPAMVVEPAVRREYTGPIVGNIPVIEGPLPGDGARDASRESAGTTTPAEGSSPRRREPVSAPASTLTSPELLSIDVGNIEGNGKTSADASHRRQRSWLGPFGWSKPPRPRSVGTSSGDLDVLHAMNGVPFPETNSGVANGAIVDINMLETQPEPVLPAGTRGIVNVGNSCYVGAAFQCLRFTPTLPLRLIPDLLEQAAASPAEQQTQNTPVVDAAHEDTSEPMDATVPDATEQLEATAAAAAAAAARVSAGQPADMVVESHALSENAQQGTDGPSTEPAVEATTATATATAPAVAAPLPRPVRGELSSSVSSLVADLYLGPAAGRGADPAPLMQILRRFPAAADYFDGGQHDCQEVLQVLIDLLHEDLNTATPLAPSQKKAGIAELEEKEKKEVVVVVKTEREEVERENQPDVSDKKQNGKNGSSASPPPVTSLLPPKSPTVSSESAKADAAWAAWQSRNCSPISDLFMGQLQSCVVCSKCGGRFTTYEPFWELSLPLAPKSGGNLTTWLGLKPGGALSLQDCLQAYTSEEKLEGEEAFDCEVCKEKTPATKRLRVHRLPDALVLHIKRFRHRGTTADKLTTNVTFPLKALDLAMHGSPECPHPPEQCCYDLYAVSNHSGNVGGGHYTACCRAPQGESGEGWWSFNDEVVTPANAASVVSQNAYILFYFRRKFKDPAAAAAAYAARPQQPFHRRSRSGGSSGSGGLFAGTFLRGGETKG